MGQLIEPIRVDGLRQLNSSLRKLGKDAPKALRIAGNKAADIIVADAKPRVPLGPGKGGHARDSIKAASTRTAARVQAGGKRFPYYPWLDFGGRVGRKKATVRPFLSDGRYIWHAYAQRRDEFAQLLDDELTAVAAAAGLGPES